MAHIYKPLKIWGALRQNDKSSINWGAVTPPDHRTYNKRMDEIQDERSQLTHTTAVISRNFLTFQHFDTFSPFPVQPSSQYASCPACIHSLRRTDLASGIRKNLGETAHYILTLIVPGSIYVYIFRYTYTHTPLFFNSKL